MMTGYHTIIAGRGLVPLLRRRGARKAAPNPAYAPTDCLKGIAGYFGCNLWSRPYLRPILRCYNGWYYVRRGSERERCTPGTTIEMLKQGRVPDNKQGIAFLDYHFTRTSTPNGLTTELPLNLALSLPKGSTERYYRKSSFQSKHTNYLTSHGPHPPSYNETSHKTNTIETLV
ncbi:hypothetical protein PENSPDRAFT_732944 [Peniophora sp. CONT]|nr:hypothetical protein PENSPDRAFT_732944 [Peniophora sp. CONT]